MGTTREICMIVDLFEIFILYEVYLECKGEGGLNGLGFA